MTTMTAQATQLYQVFIRATPEQVWDAITKPEFTQKYLFGSLVEISDDEPGVLEDAQMLQDAEAGHLELRLELGERAAVALEEPVEEMPPRRVCERLEHPVVVVHAMTICDP